MTNNNTEAPGGPGVKARWTSSAKSGIGKALNAGSDIAFTLSHGIVNEVYYPREDIPCIRDMGMIVTDGDQFFSEEKRHTHHRTDRMGDDVPAYSVINRCIHERYSIRKEILTDPLRNTFLQQTHFRPDRSGAYHLYVQLAPHMNDRGDNNNGWTGAYKGVQMLFAEGGGLVVALACSAPWKKRSVGFVGSSDGWTDLSRHKAMQWEYGRATNGNIALTGEIDVPSSGEFLLALGFGRNWEEAANHCRGSLLDGFGIAKKRYIQGWTTWLDQLRNVRGKYYKVSASVLRVNEAKSFPGAVVASLSIPWGQAKGDDDKGGYHLVWPRDLVECAGGFTALETKEDALRIVNYLMSTQREDGSWPQNMWLEGSSYWQGRQTDQTALPIILLNKCNQHAVLERERLARYWPGIKKALHYLLLNGPYTYQDRWEEEMGFTPFTLAAVIAGLLAGADIAELNNEDSLAEYCRQTADNWNDMIEHWTYVTGTPLAAACGVDGYYIRINPYHDVAAADLGDRCINLKNHSGESGRTRVAELISVDALALVRFGLRDAHDPRILNTIKVIDARLKVETAAGPCWHRYNNDGYGEDKSGNGYTGNAYAGDGIGRLWPLLTGERAHYEIAAGHKDEAIRLLKAMDEFSNNGLLSEQIWDSDDIPEKDLFKGKHSGSAMPLTWAHAEYIKLCTSIRDNVIFDMPRETRKRYLQNTTTSAYQVWRFISQPKVLSPGKTLRIEVMADAVVHWTDDGWATIRETPTEQKSPGLFVADLPSDHDDHEALTFTFFWKEAGHWENRNYSVTKGRRAEESALRDEKKTDRKHGDRKHGDRKKGTGKKIDRREGEGREAEGGHADRRESDGRQGEGREDDGMHAGGKDDRRETDRKQAGGTQEDGKDVGGKDVAGKQTDGKKTDGKNAVTDKKKIK
jgi:glucoamylase